MSQYKFIGVGLAAMVVLSGCVNPEAMTEAELEVLRADPTISTFAQRPSNFGDATAINFAAQIVDPAPPYQADPPDVDGAVILGGYGRYRTNKVKQPRLIGGFGLGGQ